MSLRLSRWRAWLAVCLAVCLTVASGGCFSSDEGETFYGRVSVPARQEFRWSDGGLPQIFDPALAAAPPDTDVVRAMFEGLTEYDARTLKPISGVALRWESADEDRVWTFHLRHDARWSNGESVTAQDFVRSWRRTLRLGERAPHARLLANLEGAQVNAPAVNATPRTSPAPTLAQRSQSAAGVAMQTPTPEASPTPAKIELGVEALNDFTLRVRLQRPDKNFPALVAHPVFRPVHKSKVAEDVETEGTNDAAGADGEENASDEESRESGAGGVISNGAFNLSAQADDGVVLERAQSYWNAKIVALERVRFVAATDAEAALSAYRAGEVDAVTNANIEPLAMKLLAPYKDFRRATFGALTFYDFNTTRAPFDDKRVRQALSLAVDRERLSADTLGGATEAAIKFLPSTEEKGEGDASSAREHGAAYDPEAARRLLAEAGFAGGSNFPRIRLLVNRNEQHRTVAVAISGMWRNVLGIETEIVLRNWDEYEAALLSGDYDVARRSVVMQTIDEESNMLAMFDPERLNFAPALETNDGAQASASPSPRPDTRAESAALEPSPSASPSKNAPQPILSEQQALEELPAIPIYFASSYALVKPYVAGFDANLLDAPSLQHVRIDTNWQPPKRDSAIRIVSNRLAGR
ncbi:MAG TPA: peptide ABC transporter substrate-binding protein [Pyrinomonadaceae bacterium]|nr:peptide ABC transporter substrate-binding protein [Pyrinomonadaceae bacterium]